MSDDVTAILTAGCICILALACWWIESTGYQRGHRDGVSAATVQSLDRPPQPTQPETSR